jgi:hypothetical protein
MSKKTTKITIKVIKYEETDIHGCPFRCYDSGKVERQLMTTNQYGKKGDWCRCDNNKPKNDKNTDRYDIRISVNGKRYYLHRIVYFAFNSTFDFYNPKIMIDHINRDSLDNRISNLREATSGENQCNQKAQKNNKLGIKNIYDREKRWVVMIKKDGQTVVNRSFQKTLYTLDEVILFRDEKLLRHHGEFANLD